MPVFKRIQHDEYVEIKKTVRTVHNAVKDTFDYVRWTITIGAIYYVVGLTNKNLAILSVIVLFCVITAPLLFLIPLMVMRLFSDAFVVPATILGFLVVISLNGAIIYYLIDFVNFLSTRR